LSWSNSIIGPKLIALDNVWKADQPALGNRAFTFLRVKEKYWHRLQCYQYVTICMKLMATSLVVVRDLLFSPVWESRKTNSALLHILLSRFKRGREVLHAEIGDTSKRNGMEQDIVA
jgi:glutathionylspermidine synthase